MPSFSEALDLHMRRHRDGPRQLRNAIVAPGDSLDWTAIRSWRQGRKEPRSAASFELLARIEARYRLPAGYFRRKLAHPSRATTCLSLPGVKPSERRRLIWHLPDDFDRRPPAERSEILEWVRRVIISGSTEYRRYQALAIRDRYALRFLSLDDVNSMDEASVHDPDLLGGLAPPRTLQEEMSSLVRFKTATLAAAGYQRSGVWGAETASQKIEHLGLLFGALAALPESRVRGLGVPRESLTFGMLVFPAVWDWYLQWREKRRGFYTNWEVDMLRLAIALTRKDVGWLRQSPEYRLRIVEVPGLITRRDIDMAVGDWGDVCDRLYLHGLARAKEIDRVARIHRDPFEPILPILEADSPLAAYRSITDEILKRMPDARRYPRCAAEAVRAFLMLRIGLHLGVRQKNMRQLLFQRRGAPPTPERVLESQRRGELRWHDRDGGWEVLIPATAFKNARSSYFAQKPFRIVLPDLARLYEFIDSYLDRHRARLLRGAADPGTFFVKTVKATSTNAAYEQTTFYEAWRLIIQRYGIYNPYTGRGAVKGLLPHGPHNLRDVLATHILKRTGSYEQASYAIQDTPETVANHYGRFLPQDKAALAAQVLNQVWAGE
ncbi:MAG: hypothetical protein K2Y02_05065 [Burkholderiaceae bacterium]|nr:hypothetical protein [Burkholderiaceae bacterium]